MRKKSLFKTTALILSLVTVLAMSACGSKNNTVTTDNTNTETKAVTVDKKVAEDKTTEQTDKSTEAASVKDTEVSDTSSVEVAINDSPATDNNDNNGGNSTDNDNNSSDTPTPQPDVPDTPSEPEYNEPEYVPDESDNGNDSGNEDAGSSGTGNNFYDDFMNGGHIEGTEDLIDKDSDPSKPCPYPLNTPIETIYHGFKSGVEGDYPAYLVYTLNSEDTTGGMAKHLVQDMFYDGQSKVNGERVRAFISTPIGEYDCGVVRATYVSRF